METNSFGTLTEEEMKIIKDAPCNSLGIAIRNGFMELAKEREKSIKKKKKRVITKYMFNDETDGKYNGE